MGWNQLHPTQAHPMLEGVRDGEHVYFVHSYWCEAPAEVVLAETDYGSRFPAIVGRGNVLGVQFHPEKSQSVGLRPDGELRAHVRVRAGGGGEARMIVMPAIDVRGGKVVRLKQGQLQEERSTAATPGPVARKWADQGRAAAARRGPRRRRLRQAPVRRHRGRDRRR
jgi:GMP synthase-like glutamine amidotransferase